MSVMKRICPYLVGDVYITTRSHNPADVWADTAWEKIEGRFLLGSDASHEAGSLGGAASHALTKDELPSHAHTVPAHGHGFTQPTVNGGGVSNGITGGTHSHSYGGYAAGPQNANSPRMDMNSPQYPWLISGQGEHTHNLPAHTHTVKGGAVANKAAFDTQATGGGSAFSLLPPYLAVNLWRRTA